MAIADCRECGTKVSTEAKTCPSCGATAPTKKAPSAMARLVAACIVLGGIFLILGMGHTPSSKPAAQPAKAESKEKDDPLQATKMMIAASAVSIKRSSRDPDAFILESALLMDDKSGCLTYRAKNGFGGYSRGYAVMRPDGNTLVDEMLAFQATWNKYCQGKKGTELKMD